MPALHLFSEATTEMMSEQLCIKCDDYNDHLGRSMLELFSLERHVDVTVTAGGSYFKCHRIVLCAASPYFNDILSSDIFEHPIIILPDVDADDLRIILDYIYNGEINNVEYQQFISILKTAEMLKIKGLSELSVQTTESTFEEIHLAESNENDNIEINSAIEAITKNTSEHIASDETNCTSKESKRKEKNSRKYGEGSLENALRDMEWGMSLMEATRVYNIPRSTLYLKAKHHSGVHIATRKDYSNEDCETALRAINEGMSIKQAADEFNIPKTVLWRRVQKHCELHNRVKNRKRQGGNRQHVALGESPLPKVPRVDEKLNVSCHRKKIKCIPAIENSVETTFAETSEPKTIQVYQ